MKYLAKPALLLYIILFTFSCSDDDKTEPDDQGIVIGQDLRLCACCGGWIIDIKGQRLRFDEIPDKNIDLINETFPLKVSVGWTPDPDKCLEDEILI